MAASAVSSRIVKPWGDETGYPLDIFAKKAQEKLKEQKSLFCARKECGGGGLGNRRVLRDPYQAVCGHRFCKDCFDIIKARPIQEQICDACEQEKYDDNASEVRSHRVIRATNGGGRLETDRMDVGSVIYSDDSDDEMMDAENANRGGPNHCKLDVNTVTQDKAAYKDILKLEVTCPYKCGTKERITIKTLERHMENCPQRKEACLRCTEPVPFAQMDDHLQNRCMLRPVECPNGCGKRGLKAQDLTKHKSECSKKPPLCRICKKEYTEDIDDHMRNSCVASCPFGCNVGVGKVVEHLGDAKFVQVHMYKLLELIREVQTSVTSSAPAAGQSVAAGGMGSINAETLSQLSSRLLMVETKSDRATSELERRLSELTRESAAVLLQNMKGAADNRQSIRKLEGLTKVLAEDVHKLQNYNEAYNLMKENVTKAEAESVERMTKLERESQTRQAQIEDQRTALTNFQRTSFNGRLLWKIEEVTKRRNESHIKHSFYSHPFFTETYGYRMCARIYFNGDGNGKNTHVSLFFVVMKGDFDALLPWPFQQKVTMKLKNQTKRKPDIIEKFRPEPSSSSFQRPKNEMNIASGCPQFAEQQVVFATENGYVVDDTMFIEIIVDPAYEALHGLNPSTMESGVRSGGASLGGAK